MGKEDEIRKKLKDMAKAVGPDVSLLGQVRSVDEDELTCVIYDEETEIEFEGVRLRPIVDDTKGFSVIPKIDTWLLAIRIEDDEEWMMVSCAEIEKYKIEIGDISFYMDSDGIIMNEGDLGGIPILEKVLNNLNSLKNYVETMKTAVSSGLNSVGASTAASGAAGAAAFDLAMTGSSINFEDMENTKVKQ